MQRGFGVRPAARATLALAAAQRWPCAGERQNASITAPQNLNATCVPCQRAACPPYSPRPRAMSKNPQRNKRFQISRTIPPFQKLTSGPREKDDRKKIRHMKETGRKKNWHGAPGAKSRKPLRNHG